MKTNIILIMADDMGHECLSCNGAVSYETPNLDKLASQGVNFRHCYSTPLCTPSRVEIMTGRYGFRNYEGFSFLNPAETTFTDSLRDAGYTTAITGKWQLGGGADRISGFGFDEHCVWNTGVDHLAGNKLTKGRYANPLLLKNGEFMSDAEIDGKYGPDICNDFALDFVAKHKSYSRSSGQDCPFFLYYPMNLVHAPFQPTPDSPEWKDPATRTKRDNRFFKDMVEYADKLVGKLIGKLEELELLDSTLIMFTGDNGTQKGIETEMRDGTVVGGKGTMPDAGTHVPFIASMKGESAGGLISDDLIDFTDAFPTIADAAEVSLPENVIIDGHSFLPQIRGEKGHPRAWAFCHYDPMVPWPHFQEHAGRWARTRQFKLYQDGRFYDVPADTLEQNPLNVEEVSGEAERVRQALAKVHDAMPPWEERGAKLLDITKEDARSMVQNFIRKR